MALTGDKVVAIAGASDRQDTTGTTASTTYTATLTGGTTCGVTFVAPPSGAVDVDYACEINAGGTDFCLTGVEVRTGGVIGSGTVVGDTLLATTNHNVSLFGQHNERQGVKHRVSGLTPGSTYNARSLFCVTGVTARAFGKKDLIVNPVI